MRVDGRTIGRGATRSLGTVVLALLMIVAGMMLPDVASATGHPTRPVTVQGVVTGSGSALAGATVSVLKASTGTVLAAATTDATGRFTISDLAAGKVKIRAEKTGWLTAFANGKACLAGARVFTLVPGRTLTNVRVDLTREAVVEGQVLGWMDPLGDATVTIYSATSGKRLRSVTADGDGYYRIDQLAAGPIKIGATKPGWIASFANERATLATADVFTLVAGQTLRQTWDPLNLYIDLQPEAVIEGHVTGAGAPVQGARVAVLDPATGKVIRATTTDAAGAYRIGGLVSGDVKLRATKHGWQTVYANGKSTFATADTLSLQASQTLTDPLLDLTGGGALSGSVMGFSYSPVSPWDDPLGGVTVTAIDARSGKDVRSVTTDSLGAYLIGGLPAGDYRLRATKSGWATSYGVDARSLATATVFTVGAGRTVDVPSPWPLFAEVVIEGQVLGQMDPLGFATVTVLDADTGKALRSVTADGSGYYRVDGLPSGHEPAHFKVRATKLGWYPSYANGKTTLATADVFTLQAGQTLTQQWDPMVLYLDLLPRPVS